MLSRGSLSRRSRSALAFSPCSESPTLTPNTLQGLSYKWCQAPDVGLPLPDLVLFLELSTSAAAQRGGFGNERYETTAVQTAVKEMFTRIGKDVGDRWKVLDAGKEMDEVERDIRGRVDECLAAVGGPVGKLWE